MAKKIENPEIESKTPETPASEIQNPEKQSAEKTVKLLLKHKSTSMHYHRCGLTLSKTFAEYEVPESAVAKLKADKWIVVQESK